MAIELRTEGSQNLRGLIEGFLSGQIAVSDFCSQYEKSYNAAIDEVTLCPADYEIMTDLLRKLVWYSPFEDDRKKISNYIDENAVKNAAKLAAIQLGIIA